MLVIHNLNIFTLKYIQNFLNYGLYCGVNMLLFIKRKAENMTLNLIFSCY